jgi:hypothetical protein
MTPCSSLSRPELLPSKKCAFSQLPPLAKGACNKSRIFSYLLRRPGYTHKPLPAPQASLEVGGMPPYSGTSHA